MRNSRFFGAPPDNPVDSQSDPVLWATALILAASTATLVGLAVSERKRGRWLVSAIVYTVFALLPLALNWFILLVQFLP